MGVLNRYRDDVARVGAELAAALGSVLEAPRDSAPTRRVRGTRGDRAIWIDLNEVHGIHGVGCAIRDLRVRTLELADHRSIFARGPKVTEHLQVSSGFDGEALWARLPGPTRDAIVELLAPASSSLTVGKQTVEATLGPIGLLRAADAAAAILASLERLLGVAPDLEAHWDVDPSTVGRGVAREAAPPAPVAPPAPARAPSGDPATIAAAAAAARDAMLALHAGALMAPFPAIDPMHGDLAAITGRVVQLPPVAPSQWARDVGYKVLVSGDAASGRYVVRTKDPGLARVMRAAERYQQATGTSLGDAPYALIAQVTGKPRVVVVNGTGVFGLELTTLGALIGDRLFVDAAAGPDGEARIAGEI